MKSLKESLKESIEVSLSEGLGDIEEFLKENYAIYGEYTIKDDVVDVDGSVYVKNRNIKSLTNGLFVFGEVSGIFHCRQCNFLKSLEGAPEKVGMNFECGRCRSLKSLEGAPKEVGSGFDCAGCVYLKSLKGAPEKVGASFNCMRCPRLNSLEGAPKKVGDIFYCKGCGGKFTEDDVRSICDVGKMISADKP